LPATSNSSGRLIPCILVILILTSQVFARLAKFVNDYLQKSFGGLKAAMTKKYPTHGISWPDPALLEAARAKAKADGRGLSNYIRRLIELDLASMKDAPNPAALPPEKPATYKKGKT